MVVGIDRIRLPVGKPPGVGNPIDMDVEERHEDADDEAPRVVVRIAHGVAETVGSALDLHDAFVRAHLSLIEDDPVRGREEVAQVGIGWADRVSEEVILREPGERLVPKRANVGIEPVL